MAAVSLAFVASAVDAGSPATISLPSTVDLVQGRCYYLLVESTTATSSIDSVASTDETWTQIAAGAVTSNTVWKIYVCEATGNRTNTTITATLTNSNGAGMVLVEAANQATGQNGKRSIRQYNSQDGATGTGIQLALPGALGTSDSRSLLMALYKANETATAAGDSTHLGGSNHGSPNTALVACSDDDDTLDASWTSSVGRMGRVFEIEAASDVESEYLGSLGSDTDATIVIGMGVPAESSILGVVWWYGTQTLDSITDDEEGLTWVVDNVWATGTGDHKMAFIRAKAPAGLTNGATVTLNFSASPTFGPAWGLAAWSNQLDDDVTGTGVNDFAEEGTITVDTVAAKTIVIAHSLANVTDPDFLEQPGSLLAVPTFGGSDRNAFLWKRGYAGAVERLRYDWEEAGANFVATIAQSYEISAYSGGTPQELAAAGDTLTGGDARLSAAKRLVALGDTLTGGAVSLLVGKKLAALGDTQTGGSASLSTPKKLSASGDTLTGGSARLQVGLPSPAQRFRRLFGVGR